MGCLRLSWGGGGGLHDLPRHMVCHGARAPLRTAQGTPACPGRTRHRKAISVHHPFRRHLDHREQCDGDVHVPGPHWRGTGVVILPEISLRELDDLAVGEIPHADVKWLCPSEVATNIPHLRGGVSGQRREDFGLPEVRPCRSVLLLQWAFFADGFEIISDQLPYLRGQPL